MHISLIRCTIRSYILNVRNPDGRTVTLPDAFTVTNTAPAITAITPNSGFNSSIIPVHRNGSAFRNGVSVSLINGSTTRTGTITSRTVTKILSTFNLTGVPAGFYNLTILNIDGSSATKTKAFMVNSAGIYPTMTGFNPSSGLNTAALPFTVNGTNFRAKASVTITNGTITRTVAATPVTATQLKCQLPLTGLPIGRYKPVGNEHRRIVYHAGRHFYGQQPGPDPDICHPGIRV